MRALQALLVVAVLGLGVALAVSPASAQPAPSGEGVRVAVLDTGVDASHPELDGRVTRQSFAEPAPPVPVVGVPVADDPDGQGTGVASVVAGETLGVAPGAAILDLQVSAKYTQGAADPVTEAAAIEAMDALLREPDRAHVVLLSFAQAGVTESGGRTLAQQARGLWDAGVLVVVPAGPSPNPLSTAPHVLTVAGREACPAPMGPSLKPDLVARSQAVQAAQPGNGVQGGGTAPESGTAYAAAQAAGAAALLLDAQPDLPVDALASFLRDAATDRGDAGPDACKGFGELDAGTAVAWAAMWRDPLSTGGSRDAPGPGFLLLGAAVLAAAWVARRHG